MKSASPIRRILSFFLDFLLVSSFSALALTPAIICFIDLMGEPKLMSMISTSITFFVGGALCILLTFAYFVILPSNWDGQTLGKRFFLMRLVKNNGDKVTYKDMFLRITIRAVITLITFGFSIIVDLITLIFSSEHLTFYDVLASTKTVDSKS